ncbi:hypothetical protein BDK51DRAFT_46346 [Blyttiomyces helicus]|uniref:Uncharacterized protein n=1 Tax=Blyttiomyces helicus TaxID=388810 RepID=A0A4P9VUT8_9FUNG|nr:hypothetical protein BDK51DRAFT_46346 [Blyttiomyces helicus]|eukprot:RKO82872.1 hypothetical protein BDK51DRAFT_46346 [Blyttiomyces helicus]
MSPVLSTASSTAHPVAPEKTHPTVHFSLHPLPLLPNELIDRILLLLPPKTANSLNRKAVLRNHLRTGRCTPSIQHAIDTLNLPALSFFATNAPPFPPAPTPKGWQAGLPRIPAVSYAASAGRLDAIKLLIEKGVGASGRALDFIRFDESGAGLPLVKYLHSLPDSEATFRAMDRAAATGDLPSLRFLHTQRTEGCTTRAMDAAAGHGRLRVVKFLHAHRTEGCTVRAMDSAAGAGFLDVVRFLHRERGEGCSRLAFAGALRGGDVGMVRFLVGSRGEVDDIAVEQAVARARREGTGEMVGVLEEEWRRRDENGSGVEYSGDRRAEGPSFAITEASFAPCLLAFLTESGPNGAVPGRGLQKQD